MLLSRSCRRVLHSSVPGRCSRRGSIRGSLDTVARWRTPTHRLLSTSEDAAAPDIAAQPHDIRNIAIIAH
ncbi:unnamed protein product, partial [Ectocarpus sp. 4 AP-2014]